MCKLKCNVIRRPPLGVNAVYAQLLCCSALLSCTAAQPLNCRCCCFIRGQGPRPDRRPSSGLSGMSILIPLECNWCWPQHHFCKELPMPRRGHHFDPYGARSCQKANPLKRWHGFWSIENAFEPPGGRFGRSEVSKT